MNSCGIPKSQMNSYMSPMDSYSNPMNLCKNPMNAEGESYDFQYEPVGSAHVAEKAAKPSTQIPRTSRVILRKS